MFSHPGGCLSCFQLRELLCILAWPTTPSLHPPTMPSAPTLTSFLWFHVRSFKGWAGAHFGPCFSVATVANDSASRCAPTQEKVSHAYRDLCEQNSIDVLCTILNVSCASALSNSSLFCFLIPVLSHSPDCTATVCTSLSTPRSFSTACWTSRRQILWRLQMTTENRGGH